MRISRIAVEIVLLNDRWRSIGLELITGFSSDFGVIMAEIMGKQRLISCFSVTEILGM